MRVAGANDQEIWKSGKVVKWSGDRGQLWQGGHFHGRQGDKKR